MSLEHETQQDTTTFDFFGRSWTVPIRRHHSHIRAIKTVLREEGVLDADDVARIFLSADEYDALVDLDKDERELSGFADQISEAMGVGGSGNSEPSPPSS